MKRGERAPDDDWTHPLYGTWEHLQPETTEVTLAAVFVNSMKTNLTGMQFRQIAVELVRVWSSSGSTFEPSFVPRALARPTPPRRDHREASCPMGRPVWSAGCPWRMGWVGPQDLSGGGHNRHRHVIASPRSRVLGKCSNLHVFYVPVPREEHIVHVVRSSLVP